MFVTRNLHIQSYWSSAEICANDKSELLAKIVHALIICMRVPCLVHFYMLFQITLGCCGASVMYI